jgi:hypothetical protein
MKFENKSKDNLLNSFETASLDELDSLELLDRFDIKYMIPNSLLCPVISKFLESYKILEINGIRTFQYFNQYFDTKEYFFYNQHHNGKINRAKVRYRCYKDTGSSFFEIKRKCNNETLKDRIEYNSEYSTIDSSAKQLIDGNLSINSKDLLPKLQVSYERITLINPDTADKITIDSDIYFKNTLNDYKLEGISIIEIKTKKINHLSFPIKTLKDMYIRPIYKLSKYCIGLVLTDCKIKYNVFKSKLLIINNIMRKNNGY